jgi:gamma-F420-2:alpha-L-glutamate ligase
MKSVWILHATANAAQDNWETQKLIEAFAERDLQAVAYQPKNFDIIASRRGGRSIRYQGQEVSLPQLVLVRTGAATYYFSQTLLRQLEGFGIPVVNSCDSIMKSRDKMWTSQLLAQAKIPVPRTMLVNFPIDIDIVQTEIGFPCVVKLVSGSQGKGVYLCHDRKFFVDLMELIHNLKTKKSILVQQYVTDGRAASDLRVWVLGGRAVVAMKRMAPDGDFRANISNGGHGLPWTLTSDIATLAESVSHAFGLDIAGIDLLSDGQQHWVCEANSSPGFEGIDHYCRTDMAQLMVDFLCSKYLNL